MSKHYPEGNDFDSDDDFTGAVICAAIVTAGCVIGFVVLVAGLFVEGCS